MQRINDFLSNRGNLGIAFIAIGAIVLKRLPDDAHRILVCLLLLVELNLLLLHC